MKGTSKALNTRLSGVRGLIARRMCHSLQSTAQLSFHARADATSASKLVEQRRAEGQQLTVEDVTAWVFVQTLGQFSEFNGVIEEREFAAGEAVDLGVAIGVTDHLTVGVIHGADGLSLDELSSARRALLSAARKGTLSPKQMRGGTATISNLGKGRTEAFTPILNPPQVALLGVSAVLKTPWVTGDDEIEIRPVLGFSLTVDHQWIDGAPANRFLSSFCDAFETVS